GGDRSVIQNQRVPLNLLNIRFRVEDAEVYSPLRIARETDVVRRVSRYTIVKADTVAEKQWRTRSGTRLAPTVHMIARSGVPALTYSPIHKSMQKELLGHLQSQFGLASVTLEQDFVDIIVRAGHREILFEVKSHPDAKAAIRESLGQLLEYAYFS